MKRIKISHNDKSLFDQAWRLYTESFAVEEQRPLHKHIEAMNDNRFYPYVYVSDDAVLLAICFYWDFMGFKYLEHFAVNPTFRNRGIGADIIESLSREDSPIILEIEPPTDKVSQQRLRFYKRNKFVDTGYRFRQLRYRLENDDITLNILANKEIDNNLFDYFKQTVYKELAKYCD